MLIRKLYKFENAHVVRNCSSSRCKFSIHGHSYKVEVLLEGTVLDNGQMIYDFGLMKGTIKDIIDSFDHATAFWNRDNNEYIDFVKKHSARWISLPVSPSAEQFSRLLFALVNEILLKTKMNNGESNDIAVNSVIVHETDTGYAQAFRNDVYDRDYGICLVPIREIEFSQQVIDEWSDRETFAKLFKPGYQFENPICAIQVK